MAETENQQLHHSPEKPDFSLRIWPPSQRTREVVIQHLVQTLSSPSILTNRYGSFTAEEAATAAKIIEEDSFSAAVATGSGSSAAGEDEVSRGIEILQVYSKEISKRMLEKVKAKASKRQEGAASSEEISLP